MNNHSPLCLDSCSFKVPDTKSTVEGGIIAKSWLSKNPNMIVDIRTKIRKFFARDSRSFPWRTTRDPYKIFIAETLLQKTSAIQVLKIWDSFFHRYPNLSALSSESSEELILFFHSLGLRKRILMLWLSANILNAEKYGVIPRDINFLKSLPGIGDYTANAIFSFAFNIKVAIVDSNVVRVITRICGFKPRTKRQGILFAEIISNKIVTAKYHRTINYGFLDLAAKICRPKPSCNVCPFENSCCYSISANHTSLTR